MSDIKVKDLAATVGVEPERLVEQLNEAGITVSKSSDKITEEQKQTLLMFLQSRHSKAADGEVTAPKKITLKRKSVSEIKLGGASRSGGRSVSVEVRKKRTYVKRSETGESEAAAELLKQKEAKDKAAAIQLAEEQEKQQQQEEANNKERQQLEIKKQLDDEETAREAAIIEAALAAEKQAAEEAKLAAEEEKKALEAEANEPKKKVTKKAVKKLSASQIAHQK